jgi:glutamine synthetase
MYEKHKSEDIWFGMEQEYTFMSKWKDQPYGFVHSRLIERCTITEEGVNELSYEVPPQGPYYCSVGSGLAIGRNVAEEHLNACLAAGLQISGINAEVMPGQWEFQVGPVDAMEVSDQLWVARWLLHGIAEKHDVAVSFDPKPAKGDWNGAGCHTNFSTEEMRNSLEACERAAIDLGERARLHIENYGADIEKRLTGDHETCSYKEYRWGVSDRGASVRIPWQVAKEGKGYIEDRRPNANCDPYVVTRLITETVCNIECIKQLKIA